MGIGRRKFLQLFGTVIAAVAVDPLQSIILTDDLYINRALGIAFRKPNGWNFLSVKDFGKLKNSQIIKDDELAEEFLNSGDPFAIIAKPSIKDKTTIEASIAMYAEDLPLLENESLIEIVPNLEGIMQRILKDYRQIGGVKEKLISNCQSVEYFANFQFETNVISVQARNRCLITSRDRQLFTLNMFDYPSVGIDAQDEYEIFVESIRYV